MSHPKSANDPSSEWIAVEEKIPEYTLGRSRKNQSLSVQVKGKGKGKARTMKLSIPRSMIPEVKRMFNAAFWDQETLDSPAAGASFYSLGAQVQLGTGAIQRIGDSIFIKEVVVRYHLIQSASASNCTAVIAMNLDHEPAAGGPNWAGVYQGIGSSSASAYTVAIPDFDQRSRFSYLRREVVPLAPQAVNVFNLVKPVVATMRVPINKWVRYDNTTSIPTQGVDVQLWAWSDLTSNTPTLTASYELFFTDA